MLSPHNRRGLQAANTETRLHVAKAGGNAKLHDRDSLRDAVRKGGESVRAEYMALNFIKREARRMASLSSRNTVFIFTAKLAKKGESEGKIWTYVLQRNRKARRRNGEGRTRSSKQQYQR